MAAMAAVAAAAAVATAVAAAVATVAAAATVGGRDMLLGHPGTMHTASGGWTTM